VLEVATTLDELAEGAHRHPVWRPGRPFRKAPLQRFPYVVFYVYDDDNVEVLAIAHQRRKPGYWVRR